MANINITPAGPIRFTPQTGSADAASMGGGLGQGLSSIGADISAVGVQLQEREDRRSVTEARGNLADFKIQAHADELARQRNPPPKGTTHFDNSKTAFDQSVTAFKDTLTPFQFQALAPELDTMKVNTLTSALTFQASQAVKSDIVNVGKIQTSIGVDLYTGTTIYRDAVEVYQNKLADTTIGPEGQAKLLQDALPKFREQVVNGLLDDPVAGAKALDTGKLDFLPPAERDKFEVDLGKALDGLETRRKLERLTKSATNNVEAYELVVNGGGKTRLDDLAAMENDLPREIYNLYKDMIIKQVTPVRSINEIANAQSEIIAEYNALRLKRERGEYKSDAALEDLLRFQSKVVQYTDAGYITTGFGRGYMGRVGQVAQGRSTGGGFLNWVGVTDTTPLDYAGDLVATYVKKNNLGAGANVDIHRRVQEALDKADIKEGADQTDTRDQQITEITNRAIADHVRATNPSVAHLKDVPNAVINQKGKVVNGAPGVRDVPATNKVSGGAVLEQDSAGNQAWVTRNEKGAVTSVQEVARLPPMNMGLDEVGGSAPVGKPMDLTTPLNTPVESTPIQPLTDLDPRPDVFRGDIPPSSRAPEPPSTPETQGKPLTDLDPRPDVFRAMLDETPADSAVALVVHDLMSLEGTGDRMTDTPTGAGGITAARKAVEERRAGRPLTDMQAREAAVRADSATLHNNLAGFSTLSAPVQAAVLDMSYNIGVGKVVDPKKFPKLIQAVAEGDVKNILLNTLDTATVEGHSVKGLAGRRAYMYNLGIGSSGPRIDKVEQLADGTVNYISGGSVIFTFKRPRHKDSRAEILTVPPRGNT
jgi:GH24 family phage-related lysozyme (muramidase)